MEKQEEISRHKIDYILVMHVWKTSCSIQTLSGVVHLRVCVRAWVLWVRVASECVLCVRVCYVCVCVIRACVCCDFKSCLGLCFQQSYADVKSFVAFIYPVHLQNSISDKHNSVWGAVMYLKLNLLLFHPQIYTLRFRVTIKYPQDCTARGVAIFPFVSLCRSVLLQLPPLVSAVHKLRGTMSVMALCLLTVAKWCDV